MGTGISLGRNELGNILKLRFEAFIALQSDNFSSLAVYLFFYEKCFISSMTTKHS